MPSIHTMIVCTVLSTLLLFLVTVDTRIPVVCDQQKYSSGCEDSLGSFCNLTTNQCECRPEFDVIVGNRFCLQSRNPLESCFTSDQCLNGSKCFSNETQLLSTTIKYWIRPEVPLFPEGLCVCPQTHYQNRHNVCQTRKSMDESCGEDNECLQPNSVCNETTNRCACNHTNVFSTIIGHCVRGKYLGEGCTGREECQYSEEHSWCIDNICLCGAGYTPDKTSFDGMPQCVIDSMAVETVVVPQSPVPEKTEWTFDYMTLLLIVVFLIAFIVAIFVARRNRNSIMQMIRPSNHMNATYCDQSHRMIPIDNSINSFDTHNHECNIDGKQNIQSTKLLPNISIELHKNY